MRRLWIVLWLWALPVQAQSLTAQTVTIDPDQVGTYAFLLTGRQVAGLAVPYVTPTTANHAIAFDVYPKGFPSNFTSNTGVAWVDVASTDVAADGTNYEAVRLGIFAGGDAHLGFAKGGTGVVRNLRLQINGGWVSIGTNSSPLAPLDVNGSAIRIRASKTPNPTDACVQGSLAWDADFLYLCTASGAWKRSALVSW